LLKNFRLLAFIGALAVSFPAKADSGFYVSGSAGATFRDSAATLTNTVIPDQFVLSNPFDPNNPVVFEPSHTAAIKRQYNYSTGFALDVAAGYRFDLDDWGAIRTEAEFGYQSYAVDSVQLSGGIVRTDRFYSGADQQRFSGTINAFYDLPVPGSIVPYIGVGVGVQHGDDASGKGVGTSGTAANSEITLVRYLGSSGENGIWLTEAGFSIAVTDAISIVPAYRYVQTFEGTQPTHILKLGVRYTF
jgi:opacity protein-like surface antigen